MNKKQAARLEKFSELCDKCGGLGEITRYFGGGKYESTIDCDRCRGRGLIGNCGVCGGTGAVQGNRNVDCEACQGVGAIGDCSHCNGIGIANVEPKAECPGCAGFGFVHEEKIL